MKKLAIATLPVVITVALLGVSLALGDTGGQECKLPDYDQKEFCK